jgi:hypothetical protein
MNTAEERLKKTLFIVEANSFEQFILWEKNHEKVKWIQIMDGWLINVGEVNGRKCCLSVSWANIDNQLVMFYYPTSSIVDWRLIDEWLAQNFSGKWDNNTRNADCDAQNFHLCLQAIKEANNK